MIKNTASQKWIVFAFDVTTNLPVTGDSAQITANLRLDGGGANAVDDTNPTELEDGYYIFDITAAESNGDLIVICPVSSTGDVQVIGVPGAIWTETDFTNIAAILEDTGTTIPALISGIAAGGLDAAETRAALGLATADLDTQLAALPTAGETRAEIDSNSTQLAAIVTDTNELELDWKNGGRLDLILDAIKAQVDTLGTGGGAIAFVYTLTDSDTGLPISNADVWATTDEAGTNVVAASITNLSGEVTFNLDADTYYIWRACSGYTFANPDTEEVA